MSSKTGAGNQSTSAMEVINKCDVPPEGKMTLTYHHERVTQTESEVVDITLTKEAGALPHQCPKCGRGFGTEQALSFHMRIHNGGPKAGMFAGAATGIAVGSTLGPAGLALGAVVGGAAGLLNDFLSK